MAIIPIQDRKDQAKINAAILAFLVDRKSSNPLQLWYSPTDIRLGVYRDDFFKKEIAIERVYSALEHYYKIGFLVQSPITFSWHLSDWVLKEPVRYYRWKEWLRLWKSEGISTEEKEAQKSRLNSMICGSEITHR